VFIFFCLDLILIMICSQPYWVWVEG